MNGSRRFMDSAAFTAEQFQKVAAHHACARRCHGDGGGGMRSLRFRCAPARCCAGVGYWKRCLARKFRRRRRMCPRWKRARKTRSIFRCATIEGSSRQSECASCHDQMDPLGFGLENFDVLAGGAMRIGACHIDATGDVAFWRELYRAGRIEEDADGAQRSGHETSGAQNDRLRFWPRTEQVRRMRGGWRAGSMQKKNYRASMLIEHIAMSFPFRHRFIRRK